MPTYPAKTTYRGGFYNNKITGGVSDRVYTAEDVRKPYDTVFTDGILPDAYGTAGNTLKVTSNGGMTISVAAGNAKLGGAWFENTAAYAITLDAAGGSNRYDCVIIQNDDSDEVRAPKIYIKSLAHTPTVADLTRDENVYEICVAYVFVPAFADSVTEDSITDTREDGYLCKVMSGVGATVVATYHNTYFSKTAGERVISIGIPQYRRDRDTLTVLINGLVIPAGSSGSNVQSYTVNSNEQITLSIGLPVVGTRIDFEVTKNVNAAGTNVLEEGKALEHHYYCNGKTDNIEIGNLVRNALSGSDYGSTKIIVHGTFSATEPAKGTGTNANPYCWFDFYASTPTRKVIIDFSDCSDISVPIVPGYNVVFYGNYFHINGMSVLVNAVAQGTTIRIFSAPNNTIKCVDCRFWLTAYSDSFIALNGIFVNCRGSVTNSTGDSFCFKPDANGITRLEGGEYYAYTADSSAQSAVIGQSYYNSCSILYGVSIPDVPRSGYYQNNCIYQAGGYVNATDIITTLPMEVLTGQSNIRGTIPFDKPSVV